MIGYIYKIYDNDNNKTYFGSTGMLPEARLKFHKRACKYYMEGRGKFVSVYNIIKENNYTLQEVEKVEYEEKKQLRERERYYIENNECVNMCIPNRTQKEWEKKFKREYYLKNWEKLQAYQKEYRKKKKKLKENL